VSFKEPAEKADDKYPFMLTTGRDFPHFHTGTMTRISRHLDTEEKDGYVNLNPLDAAGQGLEEGDLVKITSRRGIIQAPVRLSHEVKPGLLFLPIHYGETPANMLTTSEHDPIAKIPEFKVSAVSIEKV
jgi:predicted molibdopterin-dependent oxidoreductase YjgC